MLKIPPLDWKINVKDVQGGSKPFHYNASPDELVGLADYLSVVNVTYFKADLVVRAVAGQRYRVSGSYSAEVTQESVVSLDPVLSKIEEKVLVEYCPAELLGENEVVDLEADEPEPLLNDEIPIGAFLSEMLAVAVEPYPRNEGETFDWEEPNDPAKGPFADLVHLKRPSGND